MKQFVSGTAQGVCSLLHCSSFKSHQPLSRAAASSSLVLLVVLGTLVFSIFQQQVAEAQYTSCTPNPASTTNCNKDPEEQKVDGSNSVQWTDSAVGLDDGELFGGMVNLATGSMIRGFIRKGEEKRSDADKKCRNDRSGYARAGSYTTKQFTSYVHYQKFVDAWVNAERTSYSSSTITWADGNTGGFTLDSSTGTPTRFVSCDVKKQMYLCEYKPHCCDGSGNNCGNLGSEHYKWGLCQFRKVNKKEKCHTLCDKTETLSTSDWQYPGLSDSLDQELYFVKVRTSFTVMKSVCEAVSARPLAYYSVSNQGLVTWAKNYMNSASDKDDWWDVKGWKKASWIGLYLDTSSWFWAWNSGWKRRYTWRFHSGSDPSGWYRDLSSEAPDNTNTVSNFKRCFQRDESSQIECIWTDEKRVAPGVCSRTRLRVTSWALNTAVNTDGVCWYGLDCHIKIVQSGPCVGTYRNGGYTVSASGHLDGAPTIPSIAVTASTGDVVARFKPSSDVSVTVSLTIAGVGFKPETKTTNINVKKLYATTITGYPSYLYPGQSATLTLTTVCAPSVGAQSLTHELTGHCDFTDSAKGGGTITAQNAGTCNSGTFTRLFTITAPTSGGIGTWTTTIATTGADHYEEYPATKFANVQVRAKETITFTAGATEVIAGDSFTQSMSIASGITALADFTWEIKYSCGYLSGGSATTITGSSSSPFSGSVTVAASDSVPSAQTCTISLELNDEGKAQFVEPSSFDITLKPKLTLSLQDWTNSMGTGVGYNFKVVGQPYSGDVTITPTCSGATFNPTSASQGTTGTNYVSFQIQATSATSCTLSLGITGTSAAQFASTGQPSPTATFTAEKLISATGPSSVYVGESLSLTISEPDELQGAETVEITIAWSGTAGAASIDPAGQNPVTLSTSERSKSVTFKGVSAATGGSWTFSITGGTGQSYYSSTISAVPVTVKPLLLVTPPTTVISPQSVGQAYIQTLSFSLPALPDDNSVSIQLFVEDTVNFNITEPVNGIVTWNHDDSANDAKTFKIEALSATSANTSITYAVTAPAVNYATANYTLSDSTFAAYERALIKPKFKWLRRYGTNDTVTCRLTLDKAVTNGPLKIGISFPAAEISYSGGSQLSIADGTTEYSFEVQPLQTADTWFQISYSLTGQGNSAALLADYVETISDQNLRISDYAVVGVALSDTQMYMGPGNKIVVTFTLPVSWHTGSVTLTPITNDYFFFSATSVSMTSGSSTIEVTPNTAYSFTEGDVKALQFTITDTTGIYLEDPISKDITLRDLLQVTLTAPTGRRYTGTSNAFSWTLTLPVTSDLTVTPSTGASSLTWNSASVAFSSSGSTSGSIESYATTTGSKSINLAVSGDARFVSTTTSASVQVFGLVKPATEATSYTYFDGQTKTWTFTVTNSPGDGFGQTLTPTFTCNGASSTVVSFNPTSFELSGSITEAQFTLTMSGSCTTNGQVTTSISGNSTIYETPDVISLEVRELKTLTASPTTATVYSGEVHKIEIQMVASDLPLEASNVVKVELDSDDDDLMLASGGLLNPLEVSYLGSGSATTRTVTIELKAKQVTASKIATISITKKTGDGSETEYTLQTSSVAVTIMPVTRVTAPASLSQSTVFVGSTHSIHFDVTCPDTPRGAQTVKVVPTWDGSSSAISFDPTEFTFTATSGNTKRFTVEALAATATPTNISLQITGDAAQYFPQPAAEIYTVEFAALGVLQIGTVPTSVFNGGTRTVEVSITFVPPAGYNDVELAVSSSNSGVLSVSPAILKFTSTDTVTKKDITLTGASLGSNIVLSFALTADSIYTQSINTVNALVSVLDDRAIIYTLPSYIYVGQTLVEVEIELLKLPNSGQELELIPALIGTFPGGDPLTLSPSSIRFTESPPKKDVLYLNADIANPGVQVGITASGTAADAYDQPANQGIVVRARETATITGLSSEMYVGKSLDVTMTLSRAPPCDDSTVVVQPSVVDNTKASFSPSGSFTFKSTDTALSQTVTLNAVASTGGSTMGVSFGVNSPTCGYAISSTAVQTVPTIIIHPSETVTLSFPVFNALSTGKYFVYVDNEIDLTISLGNPKIPLSWVRVELFYDGAAGAVEFVGGNVVTFNSGETDKTIAVKAKIDNPIRAIWAKIYDQTDGLSSESIIYYQSPTKGNLELQILPQIPLTVSFDPATTLSVAGTEVAISVLVDSVAIAGTCTVSFTYGSEMEFTTTSFTAGIAATTKSVQFKSLTSTNGATKKLNVVLSGNGAGAYKPAVAEWDVAVRDQRFVNVTGLVAERYEGSANSFDIDIFLSTDPTLSNDLITVRMTNDAIVSYSPDLITLTTTNPRKTLTVTGLSAGTHSFAISVSAASQEYAQAPNMDLTDITVKPFEVATISEYVSTTYVDSNSTFKVSIPKPPVSGDLTLKPEVSVYGYPISFIPSELNFTSTGPQELSITMVTTLTPLMTVSQLRFVSSRSSEYKLYAASVPIRVIPPNQVSISDWQDSVYVGDVNSFTAIFSLRTRPANGTSLTLTPQLDSNITFDPSVLYYNETNSLITYVKVTGVIPNRVAQEIDFVMVDTSNFYEKPEALELLVKPLETITFTHTPETRVYATRTLTINLAITNAPSSALGVEVFLRDVGTAGSPRLAATQADPLDGNTAAVTGTTARFRYAIWDAPVSVEIGFVFTGTVLKEFNLTNTPTWAITFVPLRLTYVTSPTIMYQYLESMEDFIVNVPIIPDEDSAITITATADPVLGMYNTSIEYDPAQNVSSIIKFRAKPTAIGDYTVTWGLSARNTLAYDGRTIPTSHSITVKPPSFISVVTHPELATIDSKEIYINQVNSFDLIVTFTVAPTTDDGLWIELVCDSPDVVMFPTGQLNYTEPFNPVYTIYSTKPHDARFSVRFGSSVDRFIADPDFVNASITRFTATFRPLKVIQAVAPPHEIYVNQIADIPVTVTAVPLKAGVVLSASLVYLGSSDNVELSSRKEWQSTTGPLSYTQVLTVTGKSQTGVETIRVDYEGDSNYALVSQSFPLLVKRQLAISYRGTTSVFVGATLEIELELEFATGMTLDIDITVDPPGTFNITQPKLQWGLPGRPVTTAKKFLLTALTEKKNIKLDFTLSNTDAYRFSQIDQQLVNTINNAQILVEAPAQSMLMYMGGDSITVTVMISRGPQVEGELLQITPQWDCRGVGAVANFSQSQVNFTKDSLLQYDITMHATKVSGRACNLLFPITAGSTLGYQRWTQVFFITTMYQHKVELASVPYRIFPGEENKVKLTVVLQDETNVLIPLDKPLEVEFGVVGSSCVTVNPSRIVWGAGNRNEPLQKSVSLLANCLQTGVKITVKMATESTKFDDHLPDHFLIDAIDTLEVAVFDKDATSSQYWMFVGDTSLDYEVTLPEALEPDEALTVTAQYSGVANSIKVTSAVWTPSPINSTVKQLVIQAISVSPTAPLAFTVIGPPRFKKYASGGGTLECLGPKWVRAEMPTTNWIVGDTYVVTITIETFPEAGIPIYIIPEWQGSASAMTIFDAQGQQMSTPQVVFYATSPTLEQKLVIRANEFSGGYNLRFIQDNSKTNLRYVSVAFDNVVTISEPVPIKYSGLPSELVKGSKYQLTVDISQKPAAGTTVKLWIYGAGNFGLNCISFKEDSEDVSEVFEFTANETDRTTRVIDVYVVRPCSDVHQIAFDTSGSGKAPYMKTVPPLSYVTRDPAAISVDWANEAYAGDANAVIVSFTLLAQQPNNTEFYSLQLSTNATNVTYTPTLMWTSGGPATLTMQLSRPIAGLVYFNFTGSTTIPNVTVQEFETLSINFLDLIEIQRAFLPESIFLGAQSKYKLSFNLSATPLRGRQSTSDRIIIVPQTATSNIIFQPPQLEFADGYSTEAFLYVQGLQPVENALINFAIQGTGASLVGVSPEPANLTILALRLIQFTAPPTQLYVGAANSQQITFTAPPGDDEISITAIVEGDNLAIELVEGSRIEWKKGDDRVKKLTLLGKFATSRNSRMRYVINSAPLSVTLAEGSALDTVVVRDLLPMTRTSEWDRSGTITNFNIFETQVMEFDFEPANIEVTCVSTTPNDINVTNYFNKTVVDALSPGEASIACTPSDPRYRPPPPLVVLASAKKSLNLPDEVVVFEGGIASLKCEVSAVPQGANDPRLIMAYKGRAEEFSLSPTSAVWKASSSRTSIIIVTGKNVTNGSLVVPLDVSGGALVEYRTETVRYINITIRPKVSLASAASSSLAKWNVGKDEDGSARLITNYIGEENAFQVDFLLSGSTLNGDIRISPSIGGGDVSVLPYVTTVKVGDTERTGTTVSSKLPTDDYLPINFEVSSAPPEFEGPFIFTAAKIKFIPLEKVLVDVNSVPKVLFKNNDKYLRIRVSGRPLPDKEAWIVLTTTSGLQVSPPNLIFKPNDVSLEKTVTVRGTGVTESAQIFFSWKDTKAFSHAANFDTTLSTTSMNFQVKELFKFHLLNVSEDRSLSFISGADNFRTFTVTLDDLPLLTTTEVAVKFTTDFPDKFVFRDTKTDSNPNPAESNTITKRFTRAAGVLSFEVDVFTPTDENLNATMTAIITGPEEFDTTSEEFATQTIRLEAKPLRTFEVEELPDVLALSNNAENSKQFRIRPIQTASIKIAADIRGCAEATIFTEDGKSLTWVDSRDWKTLTLTGRRVSTSAGRCKVTVTADGGDDRKIFARILLESPITVIPRPRVNVLIAPKATELEPLPAEAFKATSLRFTFSMQDVTPFHKYEFAKQEMHKYVPGVPLNSTYELATSLTTATTKDVEDLPPGSTLPIAKLLVNPITGESTVCSETVSAPNADGKRTVLEVVVGPLVKYVTTNSEVLKVVLKRNALVDNVTFDNTLEELTGAHILGKERETLSSDERTAAEATVATATLVGSLAGAGAASQGGKLRSMISSLGCTDERASLVDDQDELGFMEHPFPISLGSKEDLGVYAATPLSVVMMMCSTCTLHLFGAWILYRMRLNGAYNDRSWQAALALARFPAYQLLPAMLWYQPAVTSALITLLYSPSSILRAVGGVSFMLLGLGFPVYMVMKLGPGFQGKWISYEKEGALDEQGREIELWGKKSFFMKVISPRGRYDGKNELYLRWPMNYSIFFDEMRDNFQWFMAGDVIFILLLGILDGIKPDSQGGCNIRTVISNVLFFLQFAQVLILRPFNYVIVNIWLGTAFFIQFVAMTMFCWLVWNPDHPDSAAYASSGISLLFIFIAMLMIKSIMDIVFIIGAHCGLERIFTTTTLTKISTKEKDEEEEDVRAMEAELKEVLIKTEEDNYKSAAIVASGRRAALTSRTDGEDVVLHAMEGKGLHKSIDEEYKHFEKQKKIHMMSDEERLISHPEVFDGDALLSKQITSKLSTAGRSDHVTSLAEQVRKQGSAVKISGQQAVANPMLTTPVRGSGNGGGFGTASSVSPPTRSVLSRHSSNPWGRSAERSSDNTSSSNGNWDDDML